MKLGFAGGAQEVGGSCICIRIGDRGILLDSGIRQGGSKDPLPNFRLIQEMGGIDAIIISHAHMDHIGSLPLISRAYPNIPIYMTPMTMELTRVLLQDSLKIMSMREEEIPLYGEADVAAMMERIVPVPEEAEKEILPGISFVFYQAGHIAGAACVYLKTPDGTVFYSGDFAAFSQQTIEGIRIPKLRPDLCIVETTYGDRLHSNRQVEENRLIQLVAEAVSAGKKVLIPSFALGRAQEVILLLRSGMNRGLIPQVPVYVDGMVREICRVYRQFPACLKSKLARNIIKGYDPFYSAEVKAVLPSADRNELLEQKGPAVFVASSGMLSGGPSVLYAEKIIPREDGLVIITGYQDEEAPGRALLKLAEAAEQAASGSQDPSAEPVSFVLAGRTVPVKAQVCKVGLSAHGDQEEILGLLTRLSPRDVFLVHGDPEAMPALARLITGEHLRGIHLPRCGDVKDISYRVTRKQTSFSWPQVMNETEAPDEAGLEKLRLFVREHYPERQFKALQLMEIWHGKTIADPAEITRWQKMLLDSACFASDDLHFFLFHPATDQEMAAARAPRELNLQTVTELTAKHFSFLGYKKAGVYPEERKVVLRFTFPDAVNLDEFETAAECFAEETQWAVSIHPGTNHTAMQQLLQSLFEGRIEKVSYFENNKSYQVTVSGLKKSDYSLKEKFQTETGWNLHLSPGSSGKASPGKSPAPAALPAEEFAPPRTGKPMEQNEAFSCIRSFCDRENIPLQKAGMKNDHAGKYIELSFITGEVGWRYADRIKILSQHTGWRLVTSETVMQNLVLAIAAAAAERAGLVLKKNPSYMPVNKEVQLKASPAAPDIQEAVMAEVKEKTGLNCRIITV
ncbi:MAG: MBL fold metallo-hydrolase [Succinimonas sp.]|nr:MBL fold metallo-hydrolase [Succinimonas sp.]